MTKHRNTSKSRRAQWALEALGIIQNSFPPPSTPKNLTEALKSTHSAECATAWDAEITRHFDELKTWTFEKEHHTTSLSPMLWHSNRKISVPRITKV